MLGYQPKKLKKLLEQGTGQGTDINICDEFGFPPNSAFYIATHHGFLDVVKCLVAQLGADANQATDTDFSTFLKAIQHNHIAIARYLHQKGGGCQQTRGQRLNTSVLGHTGRGNRATGVAGE